MKTFIRKFFYLIATLKYPYIRKDYRYFIRDNYYCRFLQGKYFIKDYFIKKKYKKIEFQGEFEAEIRYVIPFAYWHYLNGTLKKTVSSKNTKEFYFFSEDHEEKFDERLWELNHSNYSIPNMTHSISFSYKKWKRVPFKAYYRNDIFVYDKPILVIANKYNIEWDGPPLNFFDIETLDKIMSKYGSKYQIIYNRPLSSHIVSDNSEILDLNEHDWIRKHYPETILLEDLYQQHREKVNNFNHLQLLVYSNCEHFISSHGGTAALASYFEGTNIILSKRGIEHDLNEFSSILTMLSGANILHAKTNEDILKYLDEYY